MKQERVQEQGEFISTGIEAQSMGNQFIGIFFESLERKNFSPRVNKLKLF
jgi:hypothetical protein